MSYKLAFAADAQAEWRKSEAFVQEAILDELDRVADTPLGPASEFVHDFTFDHESKRHAVFLYLVLNHETKTITVLGVGHVSD